MIFRMAPLKSQNLVQAKVSYKRETQGERQGEAKDGLAKVS